MDTGPEFFIKGVAIGFAIAAPVGPIGILCIRRTLMHGLPSGLATGMGAALADGFYGAVAAFGLVAVSSFLQDYSLWIQGVGGAFLVWLGVRTLLQPPREDGKTEKSKTRRQSLKKIAQDFASTFFLTLTNPATILSFVAIFAGLGLVTEEGTEGYVSPAVMVLGVFVGSLVWWCILTGGITMVRHRLSQNALRFATLLSGAIITGFGALVFAHLAGKILHAI